MTSHELLGYCASAASGGAFLPQAVRALCSRQTRDLSLSSVALGAAGTLLWALYGIWIGSGPIILANLIVMPFAVATLAVKLLGENAGPPALPDGSAGRCDHSHAPRSIDRETTGQW